MYPKKGMKSWTQIRCFCVSSLLFEKISKEITLKEGSVRLRASFTNVNSQYKFQQWELGISEMASSIFFTHDILRLDARATNSRFRADFILIGVYKQSYFRLRDSVWNEIEIVEKSLLSSFRDQISYFSFSYSSFTEIARFSNKTSYQQKVAKKGICLTPYVFTERNFDNQPFIYSKIFLIKHLCFFWHLLRPDWSIFGGTVSLWKMFENGKIAVFEGKWRQFHCASTNWPIWTQRVPKEA